MKPKLGSWPLMDSLADSSSILLAGAGGGFDIYSGLPLYFALKNAGKDVHLANLSFASLPLDKQLRVSSKCARIDADTQHLNAYFPEFQLSKWFRERHGQEVPVYTFPQTGVVPLRAAYRKLHKLLGLDAVVLIDGGTDSLMRGDESGLGTPSEDLASIAAVSSSGIPKQYLACIGFGIDTFHGICHAQYLEAVAELSKEGAFLGVSTVLAEMEEGEQFIDAVGFSNEATPRRESIVANSIASAVEGEFGDSHRTDRTSGSRLWINPLMPIYWAFELEAVAKRNLYIDRLSETQTMNEVLNAITMFRGNCPGKNWEEIPV